MRRLTAAAAVSLAVGLVAGAVWASGSAVGQDAPAASTSPALVSQGAGAAAPAIDEAVPATVGADPIVTRIPDRQWRRMVETGTWRTGCPVGRKELRRLEIGYVDFEGRSKRGVIVAHRDSIDDLAAIFTTLYDEGFPIARMKPVERYGGDVVRSLEANNTSAFNCRKPTQINAPVAASPHANGRAIDINPVQNPWTDPRCDYCWVPSARYAKATDGPGVIRKGSLPVRLFKQRGWIWQNIKVPDYMHFDTGYPSRPRTSTTRG